jgi:hypothetical protein
VRAAIARSAPSAAAARESRVNEPLPPLRFRVLSWMGQRQERASQSNFKYLQKTWALRRYFLEPESVHRAQAA